MIRALIFDFDGLILDTEMPIYLAWREVYRRAGHKLPLELWLTIIGGDFGEGFDPVNHLIELTSQPLSHEDIRAQVAALARDLYLHQAIRPGVEGMIIAAKRMSLKLAVASSSSSNWVTGHLSRLDLIAHFDAIRTADDVERIKPAPDLFLAALDAVNVAPHEAIVFEDSANGVTAASAAGIFTVVVPNDLTQHTDLDHADLRLDSLADISLEALIERARNGHA